jgi:hypothetical protein
LRLGGGIAKIKTRRPPAAATEYEVENMDWKTLVSCWKKRVQKRVAFQ